jgi:hypothetical protein
MVVGQNSESQTAKEMGEMGLEACRRTQGGQLFPICECVLKFGFTIWSQDPRCRSADQFQAAASRFYPLANELAVDIHTNYICVDGSLALC